MTRPMPGPPEHVLETRDHGGNPDECCWVCYYTHLPDHLAAPPKRLTDAECAAEFWRAMNETNSASLNNCPECPGCQAIVDEELTWHRFAIYPHGLEVA